MTDLKVAAVSSLAHCLAYLIVSVLSDSTFSIVRTVPCLVEMSVTYRIVCTVFRPQTWGEMGSLSKRVTLPLITRLRSCFVFLWLRFGLGDMWLRVTAAVTHVCAIS